MIFWATSGTPRCTARRRTAECLACGTHQAKVRQATLVPSVIWFSRHSSTALTSSCCSAIQYILLRRAHDFVIIWHVINLSVTTVIRVLCVILILVFVQSIVPQCNSWPVYILFPSHVSLNRFLFLSASDHDVVHQSYLFHITNYFKVIFGCMCCFLFPGCLFWFCIYFDFFLFSGWISVCSLMLCDPILVTCFFPIFLFVFVVLGSWQLGLLWASMFLSFCPTLYCDIWEQFILQLFFDIRAKWSAFSESIKVVRVAPLGGLCSRSDWQALQLN